MIEPIDPLQRRVLDIINMSPGSTSADQFGLVQPVNRLCQRIVERVADASYRCLQTSFGETFGVTERKVLGEFKWSSQRLPIKAIVNDL